MCVYECMSVWSVGVHACFSRAPPGTFLTESHSALGSWTLSILFMRQRAVNKGCRAGRGPLPAPCASADPVADPRRGLSGDTLPPGREGRRPGQEVVAQAGSPAGATLSRPGLPWPCAHAGRRDVPPSFQAVGAWAGLGKPSLLSHRNDFQTTLLLSLKVPFGGARRGGLLPTAPTVQPLQRPVSQRHRTAGRPPGQTMTKEQIT